MVQILCSFNKVTEPIIVHHCYQKADLLYVFWKDIKDDGLVINWIQSVPLRRCLPLLQSATLTHQWDLHVRICVNERNGEGKCSFVFRIPVCLKLQTQSDLNYQMHRWYPWPWGCEPGSWWSSIYPQLASSRVKTSNPRDPRYPKKKNKKKGKNTFTLTWV